MLWANCQGAGMHPILFARITALKAPGLVDCLGKTVAGGDILGPCIMQIYLVQGFENIVKYSLSANLFN